MKKLLGLLGVVILAAVSLSACQTLFGRGHGPLDSFAFLPEYNPGLSRAVQGRIIESANPKVVEVVVPPGTDLSHLVATLSFSTEATISVISSGQSVAQVNSQTPNNFESPVLYSILTPKDKKPWTYRVMVRHADQNAHLSGIRVVDGSSLEPVFNPNTMSYTSTVPYATTKVTIEANAQSPHLEKMTIGGHEARGARASVAVPFDGGNSLSIPIVTVAEDQTTSLHYTITILRAPPDRNSKLAALSINNLTIEPAFSPEQTNYSVEVPYPTSSLDVRATPQSTFAGVALKTPTPQGGLVALESQGNPLAGNGARVAFTQPNRMILVVEVTAQDGSTSDYTVTVNRAAPDHNSLLSALQVPEATFSPQFDPNRLSYDVEVPYTASQFSLVALPQSSVASVAIDGGQVTGNPNSPDGAVVQFAGLSAVTLAVRVTAQDGSVRTYTLNVRRGQPDRNSRLSMLVVTPGTLSPSFSPRTVSYSAVIPGSTSSANITVQTESRYASVATNTSGVTKSGTAANGQVFTVAVEPAQTRSVDLLVTAQDGSQRIYHVNITREAAPTQPAPKEHNSLLSAIVLSGAELAPGFSPSRQSYTVTVPTSQNRVSIFPVAESPKANVSIDGKPLGRSAEEIELKPGSSRTVVIHVVAEDGSASEYTVTMTRVLPKAVSQAGEATRPSQPAARPAESTSQPSPPQSGSAQQAPTSAPPRSGGAQQGAAANQTQTTLIVRSDRARIDPHVWKDIRDAGDQLGTQAIVTVTMQDTGRVVFHGELPVQIRQEGNSPPEITVEWKSQPLDLPSGGQIAVDVAIPTQRGWYLHSSDVVTPEKETIISISSWSYDSRG